MGCLRGALKALSTKRHERPSDVVNSIEEVQRDVNWLAEALMHNGDRREAVLDKFEAADSNLFKKLKVMIVELQKEDREKLGAIEIEAETLKKENQRANQETDKKFDLLFQYAKACREHDIEAATNVLSHLKGKLTAKAKAYVPRFRLRAPFHKKDASSKGYKRLRLLRREMEEIKEEQLRIKQQQREVRSKFEAISWSPVEEIRVNNHISVKEAQKEIHDKLAEIEIDLEKLKEKTGFLRDQIDERYRLFEQHFEATQRLDTQTADNTFLLLQRQIIAKRGNANPGQVVHQ